MKLFLLIFLLLIFQHCSKPKTVLICGDHLCINKEEANQYFEENLSIEVKIIDKKKSNQIDLVELNLNNNEVKKISIESRVQTKQEIKVLNNDEIKIIKKNIKNKKNKKIIKKIENKTIKNKAIKNEKNKKITKKVNANNKKKKVKLTKANANKQSKKVVDICAIIEKCNIDGISKYLLDQGKVKGFPDLTTR